ncbi:polymorphic toxin-type HINT domain-containing protein [Deinococcus sp. 23YEL01]|uniref:polymorphic toxin-type HINT domain-containing protein n=1 Tax=Deinococcus sp. 23YEL01 TaxID=2745871 RepID=UPI001E573EDA|nr:polymorphic toxin-type HINT domain-containing protein [Deinococcus sp. 23YEL01]
MIPGHLFFFAQPVDTQPRPAPEGHGDLSRNWVGAGHLKIGDKIKQADGTTGLVANVTTVQQTREMFNLTVSEAHTYYVGNDGWLVHNGGGGPIWSLDPKRGLGNAQNAMKHWKAHGSEFPEYSNASEYIKGARDFLSNMPKDAVTKVRADGSIVVYQPSTEKFGLYLADGAPRTFMKVDVAGFHPNSGIRAGIDYFNAQR